MADEALIEQIGRQIEVSRELKEREEALLDERRAYLERHPELNHLVKEFVSDILLHKPGNVFAHARSYFASHSRRLLVICGPSGVGKGTLITMLMNEYKNEFGFSVSNTTRSPRPGEVDGIHYHFTEHEKMGRAIAEGQFIEHANVHGNVYGTSLLAVRSVMQQGKICVLDIDVQGCRSVKRTDLKAFFVFINAPSLKALEQRLRSRGTESEDKIAKRLANAVQEIDASKEPGFFDLVILNDKLDLAYSELKQFVVKSMGVPEHGRPRVLAICGPSGVGKGTLISMLINEFASQFGFSVSHTTREARPGEVDGVSYHFVTDIDKMRQDIAAGKFVEHANVHGNLYGTSLLAVRSVMDQGKICILDIDVQGCRSVKRTDIKTFFLFVAPPSMAALESRLRARGTETEDKIQKRLANAVAEVSASKEDGFFDQIIINDNLSTAYAELKQCVTEHLQVAS